MKKILSMTAALTMLFLAGSALAFHAAEEITVLSREDGSGTRSAFVELLKILQDGVDMTTVEAVISNSTSIMITGVAGDAAAIGYISLGSLNDTVKALAVDGVMPAVEAVKSGEYTVSRPFLIGVKEGLGDAALDFISFILSAEGQQVVAGAGYIAVDEAAAPYAGGAAGKIVVAGSSSVTPVMEKLKEAYEALNADVEIEVQQSDSTTGMRSIIDGICDIGMASRELKGSEVEAGILGTVIAIDGIAVIVNHANPSYGLTSETIRQIFTGEALTWQEAGVE